jgi:EAL domain-containing protein (putative c-di-GMP-specific phosphodiesterase class I)
VLEQACRQAAEWQAAAPDAPPLNVSVNVSATQLSDRNLLGEVERLLEGAGIDPLTLSLELTEGVLMEEAELAFNTLRAFKALGVRLILDDFGIGYSSLGYLKRLPFDAIKLDRAFVADLGEEPVDDAIVSAVVALAQTLDLSVIAEGVETAEQLSVVRELGCHYVQGNHLSPPVPAAEFSELLRGPASAPARSSRPGRRPER